MRIYLSLPGYRNEGFKTWASRIAVNLAIDVKRRRIRKDTLLQRAGHEALAAADEGNSGAPIRRQEAAGLEDAAGTGAGQGAAAIGFAPPAEQEALARERQSRVRQLVASLPDSYRKVVRAYYLEDRSQKEIAEREQLQVRSVESKLYRAKQWMRRHWKEEDLE